MLIVVVVAALFGIWRCRTADYFKWVAVLLVWMVVGTTLFSLGGTIADPRGDGLITRIVRRASENRADMGIYALSFLLLYWGGAAWFVTMMVRAYRSRTVETGVERDRRQRQTIETLLVLVAAGAWGLLFWF